MSSQPIDFELAEKTIELIPDHAWTQVRQAIVTALVDCMPGSVVEQLTGDHFDFDGAEQALYAYYLDEEEQNHELIIDAFKIMGELNTIDLLNSLNLQANGISKTREG